MWLPFIYYLIQMHIKEQFKCIEIKLNHRLVRYMLKVIWEHIKEYNINSRADFNICMTYKYLRHIWKHPNSWRRSTWGKRAFYPKKTWDRKLFIFTNWSISLTDEWYSRRTSASSEHMDIKKLLEWCLKTREQIPF